MRLGRTSAAVVPARSLPKWWRQSDVEATQETLRTELMALKNANLEEKCKKRGLKHTGKKEIMVDRLVEDSVMSNEDAMDLDCCEPFRQRSAGHSPVSTGYMNNLNKVDQFDKKYFRHPPKGFTGHVKGRHLLDLLTIAKLNAFALYQVQQLIQLKKKSCMSQKEFTLALGKQLCLNYKRPIIQHRKVGLRKLPTWVL